MERGTLARGFQAGHSPKIDPSTIALYIMATTEVPLTPSARMWLNPCPLEAFSLCRGEITSLRML